MCKDCGKRNTCKKLCKEAENYVNQDQVEQQEVMFGGFDVRDLNIEAAICNGWGVRDDDGWFDDNYYKQKRLIINLWKDGKSIREISYFVPFDESWVGKIVKKYIKSANS